MKIKKSTFGAFGVFLVIVIGGLFIFGNVADGNVINNQDNVELSGKLIAMNPNRAMAGSPCHTMGNQMMGDCDTREIEFEAWKYDWSEPTIRVKSGELVRIKAISRDVNHGLSIPEIGFNLQIDPGKTSIGEFVAPSPGEYFYGCSVVCGSGHPNHVGKLVVI
jgi:heme/copper-type cytochrome/quinol oxidase subunit 2